MSQATIQPVALVNGVPVDRFGRPFLTRPSDFTTLMEKRREEAKARAIRMAKERQTLPNGDDGQDSSKEYTLEERRERSAMRAEIARLEEATTLHQHHLAFLVQWQDNQYFAENVNAIDDQISRLVAYKRHIEKVHLDVAKTQEVRSTIAQRSKDLSEVKAKLKASTKVERSRVEKKLFGLSDTELSILMTNTGMTREQIAALVSSK